jgi:hypothetical protein
MAEAKNTGNVVDNDAAKKRAEATKTSTTTNPKA